MADENPPELEELLLEEELEELEELEEELEELLLEELEELLLEELEELEELTAMRHSFKNVQDPSLPGILAVQWAAV